MHSLQAISRYKIINEILPKSADEATKPTKRSVSNVEKVSYGNEQCRSVDNKEFSYDNEQGRSVGNEENVSNDNEQNRTCIVSYANRKLPPSTQLGHSTEHDEKTNVVNYGGNPTHANSTTKGTSAGQSPELGHLAHSPSETTLNNGHSTFALSDSAFPSARCYSSYVSTSS